jgi:hypothetical protein
MAKFSYTADTDTEGAYFTYSIEQLSYAWGSGAAADDFEGNGYFIAGVGLQPFVSGQTSWLDYGYSLTTDTVADGSAKYYPSTSTTSFTGNTYTFSWFRLSSSQRVYPFVAMSNAMGTYRLTMWGITETGSVLEGITHPGVYIELPTVAVRPGFFYWSTYGSAPTNSQSALWIPKANAWNGLRSNIAQLLAYKGLISSAAAFNDTALPAVSKGTLIKASMYNQAVYYINYMFGANHLSHVTAGSTPMYMYYWYQMQQYLNGIA